MSVNIINRMLYSPRKINTWEPPYVNIAKIAYAARNDVNAMQSSDYFCIFQVEPYIDSIYIEYSGDRFPVMVRRYTFHEGYVWDAEDENFFQEHCIKTECCTYSGGKIEEIYNICSQKHPEWHVQRYFTKGLRILDHVYNCILEDTNKEILYKAGLDELAVNLDDMDEINLLATKPSDLYEGLTMKVLRSLNSCDGAMLLSTHESRSMLCELNKRFPDIFDSKLNGAQCRYLGRLINGNMSVGEIGRLFRSRRKALAAIWSPSQFEIFMAVEKRNQELVEYSKEISAIDPIYKKYFHEHKYAISEDTGGTITQLSYYLLKKREEYDRKIRRSNRFRDYDWQERGEKYVVRYPQTINDFCRESVYMQNCLMSYLEALISNNTNILFVRKADDINTPFITMEIYDNTLMQAYHRYDDDCTSDEACWIMQYCWRHKINTGKFHFNIELDHDLL